MSIFEYGHYKDFINAWTLARPKRGRGEPKRMAELLRVHSTMISHILRGQAHFSLEQAEEISQYLGLSDLETEYFLELVQWERAGSRRLKKRIQSRIEALKKRATQLKERLATEERRQLSEADLAIFYSSWHFSAIRLLVTLGCKDRRTIASKLKLSSNKLNEALEFLMRTGICQVKENGEMEAAPSLTHLGADSPFVWKHHANWRLKAMERHFDLHEEELIYSAPLTISQQDMGRFRERIVQLIAELKSTVEKTEPDIVACLNIDWFKVI